MTTEAEREEVLRAWARAADADAGLVAVTFDRDGFQLVARMIEAFPDDLAGLFANCAVRVERVKA